jgi:PAS domain S-box-containing protein
MMSTLDLTIQETDTFTPEGPDPFDLDRHPAPAWIFDTDTLAFLAVNQAAAHAFGYSREQLLSMTILDVRPAEEIVPMLRKELSQGRHSSTLERCRYLKRDGRVVDAEVTSREVCFNGRRGEIVTMCEPPGAGKSGPRSS